MTLSSLRAAALALATGLALAAGATSPVLADRIRNPVAVFAGLDKITGRIISFEVSVGETVQFGTLTITPRVCWTRPPTEAPNTDGFVEVDELTVNNEYKRIFSGWMFAASPGLHGVEHPVYDVWLTDCKGGTEVVSEPKDVPPDPPPQATPAPAPGDQPRRPRTSVPPPDDGVIQTQPLDTPPPVRRQPVPNYYPNSNPARPGGFDPSGGNR